MVKPLIISIGETDTWENFKLRFKNWNFESKQDSLVKYKEIWREKGKQICDYYTKQGNTIVYKDYIKMKDLKRNQNSLLIFCIDASSKIS